nr:hypothetical protein Q903MT_gene3606 [Picea sitchensis]
MLRPRCLRSIIKEWMQNQLRSLSTSSPLSALNTVLALTPYLASSEESSN